MHDNDNDTTVEQLKRSTALPVEEVKSRWIKYYVDRWKLDPVVLAEAFDRAYTAGWFAGSEIKEEREAPAQVQTSGLGTSYPEDYRYPSEDPDYFNPEWKSC